MIHFVRIHDGESFWLEVGVGNLHVEIQASYFPCSADERHYLTITRANEEVACFHQHPDDWNYWEDEDGDSSESILADDWQVGDKISVEAG